MKVIPVAMSPIDIIGPINSPDEPENWWEKLLQIFFLVLGIVLLVLLLIVLWPVIKLLIEALCFVIALPFKTIGKLFKGSKDKKQEVQVVVVTDSTTTSKKQKKVRQKEIDMAKERFKKRE